MYQNGDITNISASVKIWPWLRPCVWRWPNAIFAGALP